MDNLDLIDWRMLLFASLWISGLALVLSAAGFALYSAHRKEQRARQVLDSPRYQSWINLGLGMFCIGLLGSASACWEMILWGLLGAAFLVYAGLAWRAVHRDDGEAESPGNDHKLRVYF